MSFTGNAINGGSGADAAPVTPTAPTAPTTPATPNGPPVQSTAIPPGKAVALPTPAPLVVTPKDSTWLKTVADTFREAVAGPAPGKVYTDSDGNEYIKHPDSAKNQWLRIVGTAVRGAAAGAAVGQGPGGAWKAGEAGIQAGDKLAKQRSEQAKNQSEEVKNANLEKFNSIKLKHDQAAQEFQLQRLKIHGTQEDIEFSQKQIDREHALGSADLGVYKDEADLARVKEAHADFWKSVYQNNIVAVPELNDKGERQGIHIFLRTPGKGSQLADPDKPFKSVEYDEKGVPHLKDEFSAAPLTNDMHDAYTGSAVAKVTKYQADIGEANLKAAQAKEAGAKADVAPSEKAKNFGEANKANADAAMAREQAKAINNLGVQISPDFKKDPAVFYKSEDDLRSTLAAQNQQLPADFASLYSVGHYDGKLESIFPARPYNRPGMPIQKSADEATNFIRTFINPAFDQKNYAAVQKMQEEYASTRPTTAGGNNIAYNTAVHHLGMAYDAAVALQNGNLPAVNGVANYFSQQTGKKVVPNFNAIKAALVGELGKTFKGGPPDIPERADLEKTINAAQSPDQLIHSGVLQTYAGLLQGKLQANDSHYFTISGRHPKGLSDDETQNVFQKLGVPLYSQQGAQQQQMPNGARPILKDGKTVGYIGTDGKRVDY